MQQKRAIYIGKQKEYYRFLKIKVTKICVYTLKSTQTNIGSHDSALALSL